MSAAGGIRQASMMTDEKAGNRGQEVQNEFSSPWGQSDIVFSVEGRQLHCNKAVLSIVSPVFRAMFEHDFKEKTAGEVHLPDKKYDDMVEFFRCIHPHTSNNISEKWLEVLLSLADEYQCEVLTRKCHAFLLDSLLHGSETSKDRRNPYCRGIPGESVLCWLRLTDQYLHDPALLQGLVVALEKKMKPQQLIREPDYSKLSLEVMRLLFERYTDASPPLVIPV